MRIIRFDNTGWRARFDDGFDRRNVGRAAAALGYIWSHARPGSTIYVGYDTRFDGAGMARAVGEALHGLGLRAIVSQEPCPTPALGWSVAHDENAVGGVMLTASSATSEFGGISARSADGGPVTEEFYEAATQVVSPTAPTIDIDVEYADLLGPYRNHLLTTVDTQAIARASLRLVADPMYGATRGFLADLLRRAGCEVLELHGEDLPDFGGLRPAPVTPWIETAQQAVRQHKCAGAFALDGDGDRLGVVDERGVFVTPHRMTPLIMEHLVKNRGYEGRIVRTYSSSAYISRQAERLGCPVTNVPMGFTSIYREFIDGDVLLGSEEYGGIAYPMHMPERDGIMSSLLLVEYLANSGATLGELTDELVEQLGVLHYIRRDIQLDVASIQSFRNILPGLNPKSVCGMRPVYVGHADGLVLRFEDDAWIQLRPSRTSSLVRARAEASSPEIAEKMVDEACQKALARLPH